MVEALFSEMLSDHVVRSAALQGLQIYVLGNELELYASETYASPTESPPSDVVLAISLRGPAGTWPPPRSLLQDALQLSVGVGAVYSSLVPPGDDEYNESLMLLNLLLRRSNEHADTPSLLLRRRRIRLLWLEGPVEVVLEPHKQSWAIDICADRVLHLSRRLAPGMVPLLQYCGVHERQPVVRQAQWLPTGPLACDEMVFDLGGDCAAGEESLRFAAKSVTGSQDAG
jgi:hypothetical protein